MKYKIEVDGDKFEVVVKSEGTEGARKCFTVDV